MVALILLGGGGHCKSVIEVIRGLPQFKIVGILDPSFDIENSQKILDIPIIGNDEDIAKHAAIGHQFVITVGQIKNISIREKLFGLVKSNSGELPVIKAKTAYVSNASSIECGTVILNNVAINSDSKIGHGSIINTGAIIEHDCFIGSFCHISPGATISGGVKILDQSFIGANATILQEVEIGEKAIVGAGSVVLGNISDNQVWAGNPARELNRGS